MMLLIKGISFHFSISRERSSRLTYSYGGNRHVIKYLGTIREGRCADLILQRTAVRHQPQLRKLLHLSAHNSESFKVETMYSSYFLTLSAVTVDFKVLWSMSQCLSPTPVLVASDLMVPTCPAPSLGCPGNGM